MPVLPLMLEPEAMLNDQSRVEMVGELMIQGGVVTIYTGL